MATVQARGTAKVNFDVELDVDIEEKVEEQLRDILPSSLDLEDVEVDEVEANGW